MQSITTDDNPRLFPVGPAERVREKLRLRPAKDASLELREFGEWTLEKLSVLHHYLRLYRKVAGNGTYIDGFAGKGSLAVRGRDTEEKGSVRIALEAKAFKHLWLFEIDPGTVRDLEKNLGYHYPPRRRRGVHIIPGDFNTEIIDVLGSGAISKTKPCFAFLDPNSTELDWTTVERLARYKDPVDPPAVCKVELWILFNTHQAFGRLLDRQGIPNYENSGRANTLDRIMGGRNVWWHLFERGAHINAYAWHYAQRLQEDLGYGFAHAQLVRDPDSGAPQYFMIHASDHGAAWDFMRWAKRTSCYFDNTEPLPGFGPKKRRV